MTGESSGKLMTAGFERRSADIGLNGSKSASGVLRGMTERDSTRGSGVLPPALGTGDDMTDVSDREQLIYSKEKHD